MEAIEIFLSSIVTRSDLGLKWKTTAMWRMDWSVEGGRLVS